MAKKRSLSAVRKLVLDRMEKKPTKGKIAAMSPPRKAEFERDVASKRMSLRDIAAKYEMHTNTVIEYRDKYLRPAMAMAAKNDMLDTGRNALKAGWELYDEARESMRDLRTNPDSDARKLGTVEALLGRAHDVVRSIGEMTGEIQGKNAPREADAGGFKQIIKVISLPKIEGTPAFAMSIEQGPDYENLNLIEAPEEEPVEA